MKHKRTEKIKLITDHEKFFNEILRNDIAKKKTKEVIISVYSIYEKKEEKPFQNIAKLKEFCKKKKLKVYYNNSYTQEEVPKNAKLIKDLHAKIYWFVNYGVYIGSANCTEYGWNTNIECGIWIPNEKFKEYHIKEDLRSFFNSLEKEYRKIA